MFNSQHNMQGHDLEVSVHRLSSQLARARPWPSILSPTCGCPSRRSSAWCGSTRAAICRKSRRRLSRTSGRATTRGRWGSSCCWRTSSARGISTAAGERPGGRAWPVGCSGSEVGSNPGSATRTEAGGLGLSTSGLRRRRRRRCCRRRRSFGWAELPETRFVFVGTAAGAKTIWTSARTSSRRSSRPEVEKNGQLLFLDPTLCLARLLNAQGSSEKSHHRAPSACRWQH